MNKKEIVEFLKALPKTDLHCHIDGSIRPETILELALKDGIEVPTKDIEEFKKHVQVVGKCDSLKEYLEKFDIPVKVFKKPENLKRITLEVLEDASKLGIKYIELRYAPLLGDGILSPKKNLQAALEAVKEAKEKFGIESGLILCAMRHEPVEKSIELVNLAIEHKELGVVAVDLAGNEHDFPPELHKEAFDLAHDNGLKITIHAGETGVHENIIKSIETLHASRIGHGIAAINDKATIEYLKETQVPLEVCVKSNVDTSGVKDLKSHPFKKLLDMGVKVTINTDNTTVSNVNILDEYNNLLNIGLSLNDIVKVAKNGIEASYAKTSTKEKLLNEVEASVKKCKLLCPKAFEDKNQFTM